MADSTAGESRPPLVRTSTGSDAPVTELRECDRQAAPALQGQGTDTSEQRAHLAPGLPGLPFWIDGSRFAQRGVVWHLHPVEVVGHRDEVPVGALRQLAGQGAPLLVGHLDQASAGLGQLHHPRLGLPAACVRCPSRRWATATPPSNRSASRPRSPSARIGGQVDRPPLASVTTWSPRVVRSSRCPASPVRRALFHPVARIRSGSSSARRRCGRVPAASVSGLNWLTRSATVASVHRPTEQVRRQAHRDRATTASRRTRQRLVPKIQEHVGAAERQDAGEGERRREGGSTGPAGRPRGPDVEAPERRHRRPGGPGTGHPGAPQRPFVQGAPT